MNEKQIINSGIIKVTEDGRIFATERGMNMYIHPFVCGVVATILVEVALVVGYAIICGKK